MHENNLYKLPPEDLGGATRNPLLVVQNIQVNNNRRAPVADLHESIAVSAPPRSEAAITLAWTFMSEISTSAEVVWHHIV